MKKSLIFTSLLAGILTLSIATFAKSNVSETKAEDVNLSGSGDQFYLLDKSFEEDESFVYTADVHFRSGKAGALAFGAVENDHYWVINLDRNENHIKLMYFKRGEGAFVDTLYSCDFIGNSVNVMPEEWDKFNPKVKEIENVNIKIVLTKEETHAYAEFYVEGIKRFGVDTVIDLNNLAGKTYKYNGGRIGFNTFDADCYFTNIEYGHSDYSYFSEPYRNQYHFQPFAKWSNDPNALCYYNGWYHVFYQTNPFSNYWDWMFWGHARSRDLIHFEYLPICLFPEVGGSREFKGDAYMWSGCAIAYYAGMSADIDALNWFPNGGGNGLLAIYTRDGAYQDQEIIYSDDEGITWNKSNRGIHQTIVNPNKQDWRDPKVFPLTKDGSGKVTTWGMTLSGYVATKKGYFLKSTNLLDWELAGDFYMPNPECIGIGQVKDQYNETHWYLTNKSRTYILGQIEYSGGNIIFRDEDGVDISTLTLEQMEAKLKTLDFGPDTYASQSFYISDPTSDYNGKDIVLNWFSGDLNASFCTGPGEYANLRGRWNGGFTTPVEYTVYKDASNEYRIAQKPITVGNAHLAKDSVVNVSDVDLTSESENPLKDVHTHVFEMEAAITVNDDSPITFKVDVGDNEFMQLGWNKVDGYYVDRTYLDDKGINTNVDWHAKYSSHILGDSDTKTFYVLSDNGGLEVFCENYSIPFYFVTTASIYSTGASLKVEDAHVDKLKLNDVKSAYRKEVASGEGKLYVSNTEVDLDNKFVNSKYVTAWFTGNENLVWETIENDGIVEATTSNQGINFVAGRDGTATFTVSAGNQSETIVVNVHSSTFVSDLTFKKESIMSGSWIVMENRIVGEKTSGNAFLLAEETGGDFIFAGQFDIVSGVAGALVFRASSDMSSYLVANYDKNEKVVKLWSTHGELARSETLDLGTTNITLTVKTNGKQVVVSAGGVDAINYTLHDDEPLTGHFGLNVFSGKASFKSLSLVKEDYDYSSGDLGIQLSVSDVIIDVYDLTCGNIHLEQGYFYQYGNSLYIREEYFRLLPSSGTYSFKIVGANLTFTIKVNVTLPTDSLVLDDVSVEQGENVVIYVGAITIKKVEVNGKALKKSQYCQKNYTLIISHKIFKVGENKVAVNGKKFKVTVVEAAEAIDTKEEKNKKKGLSTGAIIGIAGGSAVVVAGIGVGVFFSLKKKGLKRKK